MRIEWRSKMARYVGVLLLLVGAGSPAFAQVTPVLSPWGYGLWPKCMYNYGYLPHGPKWAADYPPVGILGYYLSTLGPDSESGRKRQEEEAAYDPTNRARIIVLVPNADATVWFGKMPTGQRGFERVFESPRLEPGVSFAYEIRVTWLEGNDERQLVRTVDVQANEGTVVDFNQP
jgi:uncharacterized protein (TIGR03000 family)